MKIPKKSAAITPHLTVRDVEKAARFYEQAFGFQMKFTLPGAKGRVMHAELTYNNCTIMIGPESPERGMVSPSTSGHIAPVSLYVYVENVDAQHATAIGAGGRELLGPTDQFFGSRTSMVMDPDGHQWMLAEHKSDVTIDAMKEALNAARGEIRRAREPNEPSGSYPRPGVAAGRPMPARDVTSAVPAAPVRETSSAGRPAPPRGEVSSAGRPAPKKV